MGIITRALGNNITTSGVVSASGISNTSVSAVTSLPSGCDAGDLVLLSEQTASSSSSISFTSNIDSTYDVYYFTFTHIHPATNDVNLKFQGSTNGGSSYGVAATTCVFRAGHKEDDSNAFLGANSGAQQGSDTAYIYLTQGIGNLDDECASGEMWLYNPSSTTYVKKYNARVNMYEHSDQSLVFYASGYFNTTSAINALDFKMASGNMDNGIIKMYGVKKS